MLSFPPECGPISLRKQLSQSDIHVAASSYDFNDVCLQRKFVPSLLQSSRPSTAFAALTAPREEAKQIVTAVWHAAEIYLIKILCRRLVVARSDLE